MTENFSTVILAFPQVTEVDKREPREYIFHAYKCVKMHGKALEY